MDFANLTIPLAFAAGFLSFISPCVLPLVPVYLGYLTGSTIGGGQTPQRGLVMSHALLFSAGFTVIFVVVFGVPFGALGTFLRGSFSEILVKVGGTFLILFGLHMSGAIRWVAGRIGGTAKEWSDKLDWIILPERRMQTGQGQTPSYPRSFFIGMTFAAGWTPCIGPLLGAILTLAASGQSIGLAMSMLFVYSLGLAIPFLLSALLLTSATGLLRKINQHAHTIEIVSAVFLVTIGLLLVFVYGMLNFTPIVLFPSLLQNLKGYPDSIIGLLLAMRGAGLVLGFFIAGRMGRLDPRIGLILGLVLVGVSGIQLMSFDLNVSFAPLAWTGIIQGVGCGLMWVPLTVITFATLAPALLAEASSIFHLLRNFGSSIFISISVMVVIRFGKVNYSELVENINPFNEALDFSSIMGQWSIDSLAGLAALSQEVNRQAQMIGYSNAFTLYTVACFASLPLLLLIRIKKS